MNYTYLDSLATYGVGGAHPGGLQLTEQLLAREKVNRKSAILDVGCGTGQTAAYIFRQYKCHVTALDNNKMMVEKATQRFRSLNLPINVVKGQTENLPFKNETFDFILSESVTAFTNILESLSEYKRVLKPNGVLLAIEMTAEPLPFTKKEKQFICDFYGVSDLLTETEWRQHFRKSGFRHVKIEKYKHHFVPQDVMYANDFMLSNQIHEKHHEILEQHQQIVSKYKDKLNFRVYRCTA
ncbi:class I SAM-dependent methyltransferase [Fredinandcohnia sp. QZ13]|uniref:class I SAM-dependent methyltransferase n=1 Tax=Fredinandcohnia sp. QZ13 TaxID=3073144 RepID=UPI00285307BA|nr:class I SAM-dependent methyltransferase [Fredinandcohnia sp. QZ13]MDR4888096.1 class I SAM-dependent methyltransferase [Fredinandcohnia sp. QZ13]